MALADEESLIVCAEGADWDDYSVTVNVRSEGEGEVGALIRYADESNYTRFSWDTATGS